MNKKRIGDFVFLHVVLLIYSITSVFSKYASQKEGWEFIIAYGAVLLCLMVYAILWQMVLKKFSLTIAFANKAVVVVWGLVWGHLFLAEEITISKIVGAIIIMIGICIVVSNDD